MGEIQSSTQACSVDPATEIRARVNAGFATGSSEINGIPVNWPTLSTGLDLEYIRKFNALISGAGIRLSGAIANGRMSPQKPLHLPLDGGEELPLAETSQSRAGLSLFAFRDFEAAGFNLRTSLGLGLELGRMTNELTPLGDAHLSEMCGSVMDMITYPEQTSKILDCHMGRSLATYSGRVVSVSVEAEKGPFFGGLFLNWTGIERNSNQFIPSSLYSAAVSGGFRL